jgi:hypothetical protein
MAINRLVEVADGDEEKAIRIVNQSISRSWMDFYQLKQPTNNGKSKQSATKNEPKPSLREQAAEEFVRRNGGGEQQGNNDYLKAV